MRDLFDSDAFSVALPKIKKRLTRISKASGFPSFDTRIISDEEIKEILLRRCRVKRWAARTGLGCNDFTAAIDSSAHKNRLITMAYSELEKLSTYKLAKMLNEIDCVKNKITEL